MPLDFKNEASLFAAFRPQQLATNRIYEVDSRTGKTGDRFIPWFARAERLFRKQSLNFLTCPWAVKQGGAPALAIGHFLIPKRSRGERW